MTHTLRGKACQFAMQPISTAVDNGHVSEISLERETAPVIGDVLILPLNNSSQNSKRAAARVFAGGPRNVCKPVSERQLAAKSKLSTANMLLCLSTCKTSLQDVLVSAVTPTVQSPTGHFM